MYTLNDAKLDCLKEFKALGLPTPEPLWLDYIIKLIVLDFYKQPFILEGSLSKLELHVDEETGEIPINERFVKAIIVAGVIGCYYAKMNDTENMEDYAYIVMEASHAYNDFLLSKEDNEDG